jgi:hypothetical protein
LISSARNRDVCLLEEDTTTPWGGVGENADESRNADGVVVTRVVDRKQENFILATRKENEQKKTCVCVCVKTVEGGV